MKLNKLKAEIQEIEDKINGSENIQENLKLEQTEIINEMRKIGIDKLPYSYSSLQRSIDPKTMNVHYNIQYIINNSTVLKDLLDRGEIAIIGAIYDVKIGHVEFLDA